ncbi:hypothetical protein EC957_011459 [Mortierella hygrophila]|uniref:Galactose oxidase n=1 Tax=Mortierella hygrophila TaxID=979708 RepID=A0A9P6FHC5_9FUNG|nr:hypothetical protein EC957_011459 [Mortierella hygrophila]
MFSARSGNQSAVKDPVTGRVYIPHGANNGTQMLTYLESSCSGENMPANVTGKYSAWSEAKEALYMLGTMAVGDKFIVFGGTSNQAYMNSDIFIFDTNTNLWSKGAKPSRIRQGMACATGGDYFIVWSGNDNGYVDGRPSADTLFYNIKTNKWVDENSTPSGSGNNPSTSNDSASKSSGISAFTIGQIIAGIVVVVFIVGFLIFRRRRRKQIVTNNNRSDSQDALKLHSMTFRPDASNASFASKAQMDVPVAVHATYAPRPFASPQFPTTHDQQKYHIMAEHLPATPTTLATPAIPAAATLGRSVSSHGSTTRLSIKIRESDNRNHNRRNHKTLHRFPHNNNPPLHRHKGVSTYNNDSGNNDRTTRNTLRRLYYHRHNPPLHDYKAILSTYSNSRSSHRPHLLLVVPKICHHYLVTPKVCNFFLVTLKIEVTIMTKEEEAVVLL